MLADPDILRLAVRIMEPLILAENGVTMPEQREAAVKAMALRLQVYCETLPDDSVDAIVASLLKTAPERYAKKAAEEAAAKAAADKAEKERIQDAAQTPVVADLSAAQREAITDSVRRCWSTDPGMLDRDKMDVLLTLTTDSGGVVRRAVVAQEDVGRVSGNMRLRVFAERAVRTVMDPNCANLPLPESMLGQVRTFTIRFRP
jgi:hypothetical protein